MSEEEEEPVMGICPKCGTGTDFIAHGCPFDEGMNDGSKQCYCCESCQYECAMDL
jgi:hypothetical protein